MHLSKLIMLVTPVLAFTIPEGQPSGVYEVSYENGHEIHKLIETIDDTTLPSAPELQTRSAKFLEKRDSVACGGDALNHGNTDVANSSIDSQCGNGRLVNSGTSVYAIVGCTVAYFCNFSRNNLPCYASTRRKASADITGECGWYNSGWTTYPGINWSYGYEDYCKAPGNMFCSWGPR